jgi:multisubunit Na+/H+ antiporter MnhF subunit
MNAWFISATILLAGLFICGITASRGTVMNRFAAFQLGNNIAVVIMLLLAEGFRRDIFFDTVLCLVILSMAGALTFLKFLERWL